MANVDGTLSPHDLVASRHQLPFPLYPFQIEAVNKLAPKDRAGFWLDVGTGKTAASTVSALYKKEIEGRRTLVLMPPILMNTWSRWLAKIPGVTLLRYEGSPKERIKLNLNADFILASIYTFKLDVDSILDRIGNTPLHVIVDEATAIKNIASGNHKKVKLLLDEKGATLALLSGTPLSSPADAYAYCKLIAPGRYRNLNHFNNLHIYQLDYFGTVIAWQNLDHLAESMKINAVRLLREEVLKDLPTSTITPIYYDLEPAHLKLYHKLAVKQLLELENGGKIDATTAPALYNALQQIVVNYDHFADDERLRARIYELVDEMMEELAGRKLILVGNYRMTNRKMTATLAKFGAVAVFGDLTNKQKAENVDKFINGDQCQVLVLNPVSAGYGIDGLQAVCHDMLFVELPVTPSHFHQTVARLHRDGQHNPVHVRIAVAEKTLQVRLLQSLLDKDVIINKVQGGFKDLRNSLFGG